MDKINVLTMTDSSENTGFGTVMKNINIGLAEAGFNVLQVGWGFRFESPIPRYNYTLLPSGQHPFGQDVLPYYIQTLKPEVFIVQSDTRMTDYIPPLLKQLPVKTTFVHYVVVDGTTWQVDGKEHWPQNWSNSIKGADKVVAMTKYGQRIMKQMGIESTVIYHGVDTARFVPVSDENRAMLKRQVFQGVPDVDKKFIFGAIFKNMQRKNPDKYLHAFKIFLESKELTQAEKDNCILLIHTNPVPQSGGEFDLVSQATDCGLQINKNVFFSSQQIPREQMQAMYQVMDVFIHLGTMEGFGLPIIEAMSCGLPIIGVDSCTMPELIADCGLLAKVPKYDEGQRIRYGSYNGVEAEIVDPWEIAKLMMKVYKSASLRRELGIKATERAIKEFDWSKIRKQWVDYVNTLVVKESDVPAEWAALMSEVKT